MATSDENWFEQRNKYTYLDLMMIMSVNDVTSVKTIQGKLKGAGKWVDVRRFMKKHKHFNPLGLFELFGAYSVQSADEVRDCLMGWILDNYHSIQSWLRMALEHKNVTLDIWMENMRNHQTHGDDIALYLLCRMYDKHAYVHTARYGWSTLPLKINEDLDALLPKCDIELVLLDIWSFGKVHKIRKPTITATASTTMVVIPKNVVTPLNVPVITENALKTVPCSVSVKRIAGSSAKSAKRTTSSSTYDMRTRPILKKVTQRTSGRKCTKVDYSQFDVATDDPPSPSKKKRSVDLKRKPSATRIAVRNFKNKPSTTPRPVRQRSSVSAPATMTVTTPKVSSAIDSITRTLTTPATQQETADVLKQLSATDDIPDDEQDSDTTLPIAPQSQQQLQVVPKVEGRLDTDTKPPMLPQVIGTAIKMEQPAGTAITPQSQKKVFKTVEYKLKRKYVKPQRFSCVGCDSIFSTQKELNEHFRISHPPVKCDICEKLFDTPATMMRHKYKHYEYMYECDACSCGFHFASQLQEHKRVHQAQGDWVCFKPKCGKRFKHESELIYYHTTKKNCNATNVPTKTLM